MRFSSCDFSLVKWEESGDFEGLPVGGNYSARRGFIGGWW